MNHLKFGTATLGAVFTSFFSLSAEYCGTWVPALTAFATAVGVWVVPNVKKDTTNG